jgi:hypothetical protein
MFIQFDLHSMAVCVCEFGWMDENETRQSLLAMLRIRITEQEQLGVGLGFGFYFFPWLSKTDSARAGWDGYLNTLLLLSSGEVNRHDFV